MQVVKKTVLIIGLIWFALLLFMPKSQLYYLLEKTLVKQEIKINEKKIAEGLFTLNLEDARVYYKGIPIVTIQRADFLTLLLYSSIILENIEVDELLRDKVPAKIDRVMVRYSIADPLHVHITAVGSFGMADGSYAIRTGRVHIDITQDKEIEMLKPWLQKGKKGYYYETSF